MVITYGYSAISRDLVEESSAALADSKTWLYTISAAAISFIPSAIGKLPAIFRHCNAVGPRSQANVAICSKAEGICVATQHRAIIYLCNEQDKGLNGGKGAACPVLERL